MISIGPFALDTVIVAVAVFFAWLVARLLAQRLTDPLHRKAVSGLILDALFLGLLAARLGYIAQWWGDYSVSPWSMLALGDGGFSWWVGGAGGSCIRVVANAFAPGAAPPCPGRPPGRHADMGRRRRGDGTPAACCPCSSRSALGEHGWKAHRFACLLR